MEDTAELCEEAAAVIAQCDQSVPADSTTVLLHTFALLESQEHSTRLQDSSFEVISLGSRSSSGFCEKWAGPEKSDDTQQEVETADSSSCFLDLEANGDTIALAIGALELSESDTAELLRTPSPCIVESDSETEPPDMRKHKPAERGCLGVRGSPALKELSPLEGNLEQWPTEWKDAEPCTPFSELCKSGMLLSCDRPATSTPKKTLFTPVTPLSPLALIQEGRFRANCYHRDGTPIGIGLYYCPISILIINRCFRLDFEFYPLQDNIFMEQICDLVFHVFPSAGITLRLCFIHVEIKCTE